MSPGDFLQAAGALMAAFLVGSQLAALARLSSAPPTGVERDDRASAAAIVLAWGVVLAAATIEATYGLTPAPLWLQGVGCALVLAGGWLRASAVATLADHFSTAVELRADHALVTHGPYAWVRHPAYLGAWLWALGLPPMLGAYFAGSLGALLIGAALAYRVQVEEALLATRFGDAWADYAARVPALLARD